MQWHCTESVTHWIDEVSGVATSNFPQLFQQFLQLQAYRLCP